MKLDPDELMFGVAPSILIDCAVQLHERESDFDLDDFCQALGAPVEEARPVLDELVRAGFAKPDGSNTCRFRPAKKWGQLALANVSRGLARADAEALLEKIIAKACAINSSTDDRYRKISCVVVFGSFLRKVPVLGDLDIGVALDPTDERRLEPAGLSLAEWFRKSSAPDRQTRSALRLRKPQYISIHKYDEVIGLKTPYRVVFGKEPSK
jgi:predicted nucleotidyltransferase